MSVQAMQWDIAPSSIKYMDSPRILFSTATVITKKGRLSHNYQYKKLLPLTEGEVLYRIINKMILGNLVSGLNNPKFEFIYLCVYINLLILFPSLFKLMILSAVREGPALWVDYSTLSIILGKYECL